MTDALTMTKKRKNKRSSSSCTDENTALQKNILAKRSFADTAMYIALLALGVMAAMMVLKCTSLCGSGISTDAVYYIATAENLCEGKGYYDWYGQPYTHWPPLFPTLLGLLNLTGIEPAQAARYLNTVCFGLIVFLSGLVFAQRLRSRLLILFGTAAVLFLPSMLRISVYVWSDPLFTVLIILFMLSIAKFLETTKTKFMILAAVWMALACLQRYAGFPIIATGAVLILLYMRKPSIVDRFKYSVVFGTISFAPAGAWLLRNKMAASTFAEYKLYLDTSIYKELTTTADFLTPWFITAKISLTSRLLISTVFILLLVAAVILKHYIAKANKEQHDGAMLVKAAIVLIVIYTVFILVAATYSGVESDYRKYTPIYVFILLSMLIGLEAVGKLLGLVLRREWIGYLVVAVLCTIWLVSYRLPIVKKDMAYFCKYGISPSYSSMYWRHSETIGWLKTHKLDGKVFSNEPQPIYLHSGAIAWMSPRRDYGFEKFRELMSTEQKNYLVWYYNNWRTYLYDFEELRRVFNLELMAQFRDGAILRMQ